MSLEDSEDDFSLASEAEDDDDDNGDDDKIGVSKKRKVSTKEPSSNKKSTTKKVATSSSTTAAPLSNLKTVTKPSAMTAAASSSSSSSAPATGGLPPMAKGVGVGISVEEDITRGPDVHTEAAAKQLIMKYIIKENRPYSAIQIYDNLHHRIQKSTLEKCLNTLTESYTTAPNGAKQRLLCKEYGKAKIYFPDQNCFEVISERELEQLSAEIEKLTQDADKAQKRDREVHARIAALLAEPSDDDIDRYLYNRKYYIPSLLPFSIQTVHLFIQFPYMCS